MDERPEHAREIKPPNESEFRFELEAGAPNAIRVRFQAYSKALPYLGQIAIQCAPHTFPKVLYCARILLVPYGYARWV